MRALSVRQPWAQWIARGEKTVEVRSRKTHHRGPLAICSSGRPDVDFADVVEEENLPLGCLVCVVDVVDCVPLTEDHFEAAGFWWEDWQVIPEGGAWAWLLSNRRFVEPVYVKGRLNLWDLDDAQIRYPYECPACKDPHRDLVPVYGEASGPDEVPEIQALRCEACGAEYHELTEDEAGCIRLPGYRSGKA